MVASILYTYKNQTSDDNEINVLKSDCHVAFFPKSRHVNNIDTIRNVSRKFAIILRVIFAVIS